MNDKYEIECNCFSKDHIVKFSHYNDEEWGEEFSIMPMLNPNCSFWQRVKNSFFYIFNVDRKRYWYHFDSVEMSRGEFDKFKEWVNSL
jgi:hypothetical protein